MNTDTTREQRLAEFVSWAAKHITGYEKGQSRDCEHINSALSDRVAVDAAQPLSCNTKPQRCFTGQMIGHAKFLLAKDKARRLIDRDPITRDLLFPYLNGKPGKHFSQPATKSADPPASHGQKTGEH